VFFNVEDDSTAVCTRFNVKLGKLVAKTVVEEVA